MGCNITGNCPLCGRDIYDDEPHDGCLRDRFAMAALTGMLAGTEPGMVMLPPDQAALDAYHYADAMMERRNT